MAARGQERGAQSASGLATPRVSAQRVGSVSREFDESFVTGRIGRLFIVRWRARLTAPAMRRVFEEMLEARRELGVTLVNISIIPDGVDGPSAEDRAETGTRMHVIDYLCEAIYTVLEGDSTSHKVFRGLMSVYAMLLRPHIDACSTVEEAFAKVGARLNLDPAALLAEARAQGLLE